MLNRIHINIIIGKSSTNVLNNSYNFSGIHKKLFFSKLVRNAKLKSKFNEDFILCHFFTNKRNIQLESINLDKLNKKFFTCKFI